ncbi:hypothetical protein B0H10DRAFT_1951014 [Mycena sp. CBHHK59/15]|nr:hypothetical protein B0H10DRAFT_1951014 [Mycena sp. CBHHK59/15]
MTFQTTIFSSAVAIDNAMARGNGLQMDKLCTLISAIDSNLVDKICVIQAANGNFLFTLESITLAFDALLDTLHRLLAQRAAREAAFYASASGCDFQQSRRYLLGPVHLQVTDEDIRDPANTYIKEVAHSDQRRHIQINKCTAFGSGVFRKSHPRVPELQRRESGMRRKKTQSSPKISLGHAKIDFEIVRWQIFSG